MTWRTSRHKPCGTSYSLWQLLQLHPCCRSALALAWILLSNALHSEISVNKGNNPCLIRHSCSSNVAAASMLWLCPGAGLAPAERCRSQASKRQSKPLANKPTTLACLGSSMSLHEDITAVIYSGAASCCCSIHAVTLPWHSPGSCSAAPCTVSPLQTTVASPS